MNTATIRRANGRGGRGGLSAGGGRRAAPRKSLMRRLVEALPLDEDRVHLLMTWALGLVLIAMLGGAAAYLGLPAMLWERTSDMARRAGLEVAHVQVNGTRQLDERLVSNLALQEKTHSMISLDLAGLRAKIMTLGWVKEARVSRRLPDTLIVNIVERTPVAVWQHEGKLSLVDAEGVALSPVDPRAMPAMPFVIGPDANHQTAALARLLDAAPALKPLIKGGTWVGNRRWDILFASGETLALPEGDAAAAAALVNFARMDGTDRLLGRGFVRFDMRDPARFVLRLPPGQSSGEAAPKPPAPAEPAATDEVPQASSPAAAPATTA